MNVCIAQVPLPATAKPQGKSRDVHRPTTRNSGSQPINVGDSMMPPNGSNFTAKKPSSSLRSVKRPHQKHAECHVRGNRHVPCGCAVVPLLRSR